MQNTREKEYAQRETPLNYKSASWEIEDASYTLVVRKLQGLNKASREIPVGREKKGKLGKFILPLKTNCAYRVVYIISFNVENSFYLTD